MKTRLWLGMAMIILSGLAGAPPWCSGAEEKAVFELKEVSAFEQTSQRTWLQRGQTAPCTPQPDQAVKKYPELKSKKPLYGSVVLGRDVADPKSGVEYQFVVDESDQKVSGSQYDRLYFDLNRDLDLTNDPVLMVMKDPPAGVKPPWEVKQVAVFDYVAIPFDYGPEVGSRPLRILPRLSVNENYAQMSFVPSVARKGMIKIGKRQYEAVLIQPYTVSGRFDKPYIHLELMPNGFAEGPDFRWGLDELGALREVDGQFYTLSASPLGEKLTVEPYRGELGTFAVGAGGRDIKNLGMSGSLRTTVSAVGIGPRIDGPGSGVRECRVPVGDYLPSYMTVQFGRLRICISQNYHSDGHPRDTTNRDWVYGMKVREDKPFVLDFSNKPNVLFASPARNQTFKPGDEVNMAAVLVDPVLDIMIRRLDDTTHGNQSLDPAVTITDASGREVYTGKMPFG
ncbi:MAG: hypothetical protein ACM359_15130 [Bacillota bacterium]